LGGIKYNRQIIFELKGKYLQVQDKWKEDFLEEIKKKNKNLKFLEYIGVAYVSHHGYVIDN